MLETLDFCGRLSVQGFNAEWKKPELFALYTKNEVQKWGAIVKAANVKVE
jgi:tripartite-type tricarboxylate transporter receptor subunit TctC